jgi:hypothetical protein
MVITFLLPISISAHFRIPDIKARLALKTSSQAGLSLPSTTCAVYHIIKQKNYIPLAVCQMDACQVPEAVHSKAFSVLQRNIWEA